MTETSSKMVAISSKSASKLPAAMMSFPIKNNAQILTYFMTQLIAS